MSILFKAFWCGCASLGFGVLFNVTKKDLPAVWVGGAIVGLVKFSVLNYLPSSIVLASFLAALMVGIFSMILSNGRHEPHMIFAIPSVIPLVPGVFAYRTMFGLIRLSGKMSDDFSNILSETVRNGVLTLFIILSFTIGIIIPYEIGKDISKKNRQKNI